MVEETPAQILRFLELTNEQAASGGQPGAGPHAVVQSCQEEQKDFPPFILAKHGALAGDFCVCLCTAMSGHVAVVQNQELENEFFAVSSKDDWLVKFHKKLEAGDENDRNDETDTESKQCVHQEQDSDVHNEEEIGEVTSQIR